MNRNKKTTVILTTKEAEDKNLRPLTIEYKLPKEQWMVDNVIADMIRGNIQHALVDTPNGIEIWRSDYSQ